MSPNQDPRTKYPVPPFPEQQQDDQPGATAPMRPEPDHGERSYRGSERLAGSRALITGGDSGIGRAVAIAFAREGADVAISYLREESDDAEATAAEVERAGRSCVLLPGDLRDERVIERVIERTVAGLGGLDLLVLNAGVQHRRAPNARLSRSDALEVFETNLLAPLLLMREAAPHLEPGSSVIVTASVQAFDPSPDLLDYAMTKSALVGFTRALAEEQAERGVRVNAVAPGPIWTPLIPATGWDEKQREFGAASPLGRPGQPAELAGAYVYLASEDASYTSGAVIPVTGGRHL
ncbi:NAD(P)-dependent oxidoreductase [Leucobacter sp. OLIS6]|uniref:SDR family oxidoreductase n=1 Tax=unclassified Leucobacter TaxID=2621730 RepID=UPI000C19F0D0|nr:MULTISPECIES: SDR family oxidoreductase [unclassified Leucobacter]PII81365.1 NAD(P)-dependent oxidoreductase [Leucobacter sp. OLCALW19]PII86033.1 NAD(P)-dependent oxidoreductase [Leucobacter sp. OLTLW20]PII89929.1 NAD(P)-dependent oxidoreductase [Leucobacter sp. OLAS13]PII96960.1 NAD(P)-dependent oxidoreductase [Leucobacter sp. OLDS2]PII99148.1 NAD(P)-dependent oxidoreductase [Leucobacter sp. OLCS4]